MPAKCFCNSIRNNMHDLLVTVANKAVFYQLLTVHVFAL